MSTVEILVLLFMIAGIGYWLESMRSKEIASMAGKLTCNKADVDFLDDTVMLHKLSLRRDAEGNMRIYREYRFEFASDGSHRYHGEIIMLGKRVSQVAMEPYRMHT
jgi:hypothetical protein